MAQRVLGLDLGAKSLKAVLIESTYRAPTVLESVVIPLAPSPPPPVEGAEPQPPQPPYARQMAALQELLADKSWLAETVVVSLPGNGVSSHVITLPFTDAKRIEQTISYEVEGQIPFDLDVVSWDWQSMGGRDGKTNLYVGVVRKAELTELLAALAQVGVDPRTVLPAGPALSGLFGAGFLNGEIRVEDAAEAGFAADGTEVIFDIGHERCTVCIVSGGVCEGARTFSGGALQLQEMLSREMSSDLRLSPQDAADLLEAEVDGRASLPVDVEERVFIALRKVLAPVVRELRTTLRGWQARTGKKTIRRLLLAGETGRLPGLADILRAEVDAPVELISFAGQAAERIPPERAPSLALALALALRGHQGARAGRLNLRRGDLSFTKDFQHLRGKLTRLAIYAGLVLALGVVGSVVKVATLSHQESLLDAALCSAEQKVLGKCYDNVETAESVLKGRGTSTAGIPRVAASDVLAELAAHTPSDITLRYDRIDVTKEKLHLQGTTDAAENVDRIISALKGSRCFTEPRSGGARRRGADSKFEFTIDSDLSCEGSSGSTGGKT
jgi:general secretion pathway protein L